MTRDPFDCPPPETLEELAARRDAGVNIEIDAAWAHISRCPACTRYLDAAAFANRFSSVMGGSRTEPHAPASHAPVPPFSAPPLPGYRIVHEIAKGGQGVVYRGVQQATGQAVAIKVIPTSAQSTADRDRFAREIQIASSLAHPGVVRIFDSFALPDGRGVLIMELVEGATLDRWLETRRGHAAVIELLAQVADALHHAHQRGVIHRDLKPSNIIVDQSGRPRVLDFGVACWTQSHVARLDISASRIFRLTRTGAFAGTLAYAAPEQLSLEASIPDVRSDIYALGVIAYEAILGHLPYPVDGSLETVVGHIVRTEPLVPARGAMDQDLWTVISNALAKDPSRRYRTAANLADDLRNAASGRVIDARRDSAWYVLRKTARRHRFAVLLGVVSIMATFAVLSTLAVSNARLTRALHESTMDRLRTAGVTGDRVKAESILWHELDVDLGAPGAPPDPWSGPPRRRDAIWAFVQMQTAAECRAAVVLPGVPRTVTPLPESRIALCNLDSSADIVSLRDMSVQRIAEALNNPGQLAFVTPSGARLLTLFDDSLECRELKHGANVFRAALPAARAGDRMVRVVDGRVAISELDGRIVVRGLPDLAQIFEVDDAIPVQMPWLDRAGRWLAYLARTGEFVAVDMTGGQPGIRVAALERSAAEESGRGLMVSVHASEDLTLGVISSLNGVRLVNLAITSRAFPLPGGPSYRVALNLSPDARVLSLGSSGDSRLQLWDARSWSPLPPLGGHAESVLQHAILPDGREVVTIDRNATLRLWRLPGRGWRRTLSLPTTAVQDLALSPTGGTLYFAGSDGALWGVNTSSVDVGSGDVPPQRRIADAGLSVACDPATGRLAFTAGDERVRITSQGPSADSAISVNAPAGERVHSLRFSASGDRLAVCTLEGTLMIVDAKGGIAASRDIGSGEGSSQAAALRWSPDGRTIGVAMRDGSVVLADPGLTSVERVLVSPLQVRGIDFSPDSRVLAAVGNDAQVILLDVAHRRVRARLRVTDQTLFCVAFHPAGQTLAVGDRAGRVMIVDPARPSLLATLSGSGPVTALEFTPDGTALLVGALSAGIERWDLQDLAGSMSRLRPGAWPVLRRIAGPGTDAESVRESPPASVPGS